MVIGAIAGDVIGSRFEFDRGPWTKYFKLFTEESGPTDDTIMTVAVANGLILVGEDATEEEVKTSVVTRMRQWGQVYPNAGYGQKFIKWLLSDEDPWPYNSFGNGSAMRTSAVGWLYDSLERTLEVAKWVAEVSHNHPEVNVLGDKFVPHVIFKNGFDGKHKIMAAITPLRLVCQNQFNFAFKNAKNAITIRHVGNAEAKLEEARETLKLSAEYMEELTRMAEHFAGMKISGPQMEKVVKYLFPIPEDDTVINPFRRKSLENARTAFITAHEQEDNRNFRGTAWGLVNAYTDYITHKEPAGKRDDRYEGKFVNTTFKVSMNPIINAIEAVK